MDSFIDDNDKELLEMAVSKNRVLKRAQKKWNI